MHGAIITWRELENWLVGVSVVSTPQDGRWQMRVARLLLTNSGRIQLSPKSGVLRGTREPPTSVLRLGSTLITDL